MPRRPSLNEEAWFKELERERDVRGNLRATMPIMLLASRHAQWCADFKPCNVYNSPVLMERKIRAPSSDPDKLAQTVIEDFSDFYLAIYRAFKDEYQAALKYHKQKKIWIRQKGKGRKYKRGQKESYIGNNFQSFKDIFDLHIDSFEKHDCDLEDLKDVQDELIEGLKLVSEAIDLLDEQIENYQGVKREGRNDMLKAGGFAIRAGGTLSGLFPVPPAG